MTEIVNLNKARKAKVRSQAQVQAVRNRVAFGLTKAQKEAAGADKTKADASLDGHKRSS